MPHDVVPMVEIRPEIERLWAVKSQGQNRPTWCILQQEALWVASGNGDGRAGKPRYNVGAGVENRYEAKLTNQRRGSGSKT